MDVLTNKVHKQEDYSDNMATLHTTTPIYSEYWYCAHTATYVEMVV